MLSAAVVPKRSGVEPYSLRCLALGLGFGLGFGSELGLDLDVALKTYVRQSMAI